MQKILLLSLTNRFLDRGANSPPPPPVQIGYKNSPVYIGLRIKGISDPTDKAQLVLSRLTESELYVLEGKIALIFANPDPYDQIKSLTLKHFERSESENLTEFLYRSRLEKEERPSDFLRRLRRHINVDTELDNKLLRRVFLDNLPATYRHILVLQENHSLNHLASLADKLFFEQKADQLTHSTSTSQVADHTNSSFRAPPTENHALMMIQAELKSLKADLANLSDNSFRSGSAQNSPRNKSYFSSTPQRQQNSNVSSPSPIFVLKKVNYFSRPVDTAPRSTQTALSKSNNSKRNTCFYHSRFGANAQNCSKRL